MWLQLQSKAFGILGLLMLVGLVQANPFNGMATKGNLSVWRINENTGEVSLCSYSQDDAAPSCYPWGGGELPSAYKLISSDDLLSIWRIDKNSGRVSLCEYVDVTKPPSCTPWG